MSFNTLYNEYKSYFDNELLKSTDLFSLTEENLIKSMKYSLHAGGKRIRPILMFMVSDVLGVDKKEVLPFAIAIEYIHSYSLIHDDLPAMDNDDLRRGKPTNHVVFGEDMAILAGDALLNKAFEIVLRNVNGVYSINAGRILSNYAGMNGMIGGQALDILSEDKPLGDKSEETLYNIHANKTGRLLSASVLVPSCLAGNLHFDELSTYGKNLGLLFQITDDLLDFTSTPEKLGKSVNKDKDSNKLTFVTLFGLEEASKKAEQCYLDGVKAVENIDNNSFLIDLLNFVKTRNF